MEFKQIDNDDLICLNPANVCYVRGAIEGETCNIVFEKGHFVTVKGNVVKIAKQLGLKEKNSGKRTVRSKD